MQDFYETPSLSFLKMEGPEIRIITGRRQLATPVRSANLNKFENMTCSNP